MRVLENEQQLCPCYKECQEFQKLVELKDAGLTIYCYRPHKKDIRQAEAVESAVNTSSDAFILHNKKDVKIKCSELTSELETKNISCPRCRKKLEHAQKLMQEVKSIDRKIVMGICDHCRDKATTTAKTIEKPFCVCNEIVKKIINVKGEQKEDITKYVKIWLSKMGHLLKDEITLNKPKQIKTRAYSDLQIRGLNSPASIYEPEIQQLFDSGMHKSDINLNTEMRETNLKEGRMKQAVAFYQPIEYVETTIAHTPLESEKINALIPTTLLEDSDITFVETYVKQLPRPSLKDRKQEEVFEDEPSIDAKEALKRRHDLSLRQMMRLEKDSRVPYSVSKRPYIYETPKIAPWAQKEPTSKYHVESEVDIKIPKLKHDRGPRGTRDLDYVSNRDVKFRSTKPSQDYFYDLKKRDKYQHDKIKQGLYDSKEGPIKVKKSDQHMVKSKSWHKKALEPKESVGFVKKSQYSFIFPTMMEKDDKEIKVAVTSSYLIKDTQEKFRLKAETEKKRKEEERQKNLEQAQKKKLAREETKLQADERKKQLVEYNKYAEAQKRQQDKAKRDKTKGDTFDNDGKIFSESEQKGKMSKESVIAKKDTKSEPDRINEELDKPKKDTKSKPEQGDKIDEILKKIKKGTKSKPEQGDKIDEILDKTKKGTKSKPEQIDKIDEILDKTKKGTKSKPEQGDKIDEILDTKKGTKSKPEQGDKIYEILDEQKGTKSKPEQGDKIYEILEKPKIDIKGQSELVKKGDDDLISKVMKEQKTRDEDDETTEKEKDKERREEKDKEEEKPEKNLKAKSKQNYKGVEKEQRTKTEKEEPDEKLQREQEKERLKQIEELRKDKEALKQQATKNREELSKEIKSSKKERDSSEEIKMSMSKIEKSVKKREKEEPDEKLQREQEKGRLKQIEQLRKEKEALNQQATKNGAELSNEIKSSKKKRDSSEEIKMSMSKIEKSMKQRENEEKTTEKEKYKERREEKDKEENPKKTKTEKEELDEKLQREQEKHRSKQIEQLRKEKEALKQQAIKNREELSKEIKSSKKKQDSSEEIKMSISEIEKSMKKREKEEESATKNMILVIKKEENKEKEIKQKESKVKPSMEEAEFKRLLAIHLKEKENTLKKKKQLENEAKAEKVLEEAKRNAKNINVELLHTHKCQHEVGRLNSLCALCLNSDLELAVLSLDNKINLPEEKITDMIIGEKIFKIKRRLEKTKEPEVVPKLYRQIVFVESDYPPKQIVKIIPHEAESDQVKILSKKDTKEIDMEPGKGILRYALSDRSFIDKGWTMLPTEKVVRKMNVYRMRPAHPEFDWFEHNKNKRLMTYDTGERLAEFDDNGRGRWYYRNGRLALDYYDAEETNAQQRFVIYSSGEPDERGRTHPITIIATFDYLGNGIVFDHTGKIRLKYNQTEGVVLDRGIGPVSHWKWHTLNDPPVLQQVMIDTQMAHKDPNILKLGSAADRRTRPDNEEMLAIEFDNFIKEKSKKLSQKFKPFQIKMKALKINEHFSLKVLDQATVYLIFRDGSTNLKLNIGMILDHQEIVDTDTAEVGEVSNSLERFPARTDSLAGLQCSVANAQRYERLQVERERRLRHPEPCASADQLTAAASVPMRLPLRTVPTGYSSSSGYCSRKPTNNLYYQTSLL